jgi:hypothetical protein
MGGGGDGGHRVAVRGGGDRPPVLVPGLPRRDEQHLVERQRAGGLARLEQVAMVDRVEGAAEDAEPRPAVGVPDGSARPAAPRPRGEGGQAWIFSTR